MEGMSLENRLVGDERIVVRRARAADVPGLAALVGADPISAARDDSGDGDLAHDEAVFAAIDADPHQLLVQLTTSVDRIEAHRFSERLGFTASHVGFELALPGDRGTEAEAAALNAVADRSYHPRKS